MVFIDIIELRVHYSVKLNRKNMIRDITLVLSIEEAQKLGVHGSGEIVRGGDEEGHPMTAGSKVLSNNCEYKCGWEGRGGPAEANWRGIEGMAFRSNRFVS